jgi:hypothetical protein
LCRWLGDKPGAIRWYEYTLANSDEADLIAEAACRVGEILLEGGDPAAARLILKRAAATGDATFAAQAVALLAAAS